MSSTHGRDLASSALSTARDTTARSHQHPTCVTQSGSTVSSFPRKSCDAKVRAPLAAWHVGSEYAKAACRILFVGKPHRNKPGAPRPSRVLDARAHVENSLRKEKWAYWRYTQEIAKLVHREASDGWERIAMTNIVKCTNVSNDERRGSTDRTTRCMVERCARDLGVIEAEIDILKPTHVVLLTGSMARELIASLSLGARDGWCEVSMEPVACGKKMMAWRDRIATARWGEPIKSLIVAHPERMAFGAYATLVKEWLVR